MVVVASFAPAGESAKNGFHLNRIRAKSQGNKDQQTKTKKQKHVHKPGFWISKSTPAGGKNLSFGVQTLKTKQPPKKTETKKTLKLKPKNRAS